MAEFSDKPLSKGASIRRLKEKAGHRRWPTKVPLDDVWQSSNHTGTLESEVQMFLDGNHDVQELKHFPQCAFRTEFLMYCIPPISEPPPVSTPNQSRIGDEKYLWGLLTTN